MKSIKFASAIALAAGVLVMGSAQAQTFTGGEIRVTGAVSDETCTIKGGAGTDGGTGNIGVALEKVAASELATVGKAAGHKPFTLILGGKGQGACQDGKVARLSFNTASGPIDAGTGTLRNVPTDGTAAANTNIQLTTGAATSPIDLNNPNSGVDFPAIVDNTATVTLGAQYYPVGPVTAGLVDTHVQYVASYN